MENQKTDAEKWQLKQAEDLIDNFLPQIKKPAPIEFYHPRLDPKLTDKANTSPADLTPTEAARLMHHAANYCTLLSEYLGSFFPLEKSEIKAYRLAAKIIGNHITKLGGDKQALADDFRAYLANLESHAKSLLGQIDQRIIVHLVEMLKEGRDPDNLVAKIMTEFSPNEIQSLEDALDHHFSA